MKLVRGPQNWVLGHFQAEEAVSIFRSFRSPFRSMHANPNKRSDWCHYDVRKVEAYIKTRARDVNQ